MPLPERPGLLAQRPRQRLDLQAGRLPGPQEVALLPGEQGPGAQADAGGGAALHRHGAADRGGPDADWKVSCSHAVSLEGAPYGGTGFGFPGPRWKSTQAQAITIPPATGNRVPQRIRGQCWSRWRHRRLPVRDRLGMFTVARHTAPMQAAAARMMPPARRAPGYPAMTPVSPAMPPSAAAVITAMAPPRMMRSFY